VTGWADRDGKRADAWWTSEPHDRERATLRDGMQPKSAARRCERQPTVAQRCEPAVHRPPKDGRPTPAVELSRMTCSEVWKHTALWGPVDKDGTPKNADAKSRDVVFTESLTSGGWTTAELVLEGVPPTDLGFVRLHDVGHRAIRLRRATGN
jgi:hypothetical protein